MSMLKNEVVEINGNKLETDNLSHLAIGLYKNNKTGEWTVARFEFDPVTKAVKFQSDKPAGDGTLDSGTELFKLIASREIIP